MTVKPAYAASLVIPALTFVSAVSCLIMPLDLRPILPFWEAALLIFALTVLTFFAAAKSHPAKALPALAVDLLFLIAVFLLIYTGTLDPAFVIKRPLGLGASFGYGMVLPFLMLLASILTVKDLLNIHYAYSAKGREALVFTAIRLSAVVALLILGGILFIIIYKGIGIISWEFLTTPHRRLGQAGGISTAGFGVGQSAGVEARHASRAAVLIEQPLQSLQHLGVILGEGAGTHQSFFLTRPQPDQDGPLRLRQHLLQDAHRLEHHHRAGAVVCGATAAVP